MTRFIDVKFAIQDIVSFIFCLYPNQCANFLFFIISFFFLTVSSVDVKSEVPVGLEPISPLDLRTDLRMMMPVVDPVVREKQLQQELLLIQQQQQIQKQLLIAEFQKQHENLTRQHQAQLQEHIKVADVSFLWPFHSGSLYHHLGIGRSTGGRFSVINTCRYGSEEIVVVLVKTWGTSGMNAD